MSTIESGRQLSAKARARVWLIANLAPFWVSTIVLIFATGFLTTLALFGFERDLSAVEGGVVSHPEVIEMFVWHLVAVVPLLEVSETLQWGVPVEYEGTSVGVLLLIYKAILVLPIVSFVQFAMARNRARVDAVGVRR